MRVTYNQIETHDGEYQLLKLNLKTGKRLKTFLQIVTKRRIETKHEIVTLLGIETHAGEYQYLRLNLKTYNKIVTIFWIETF